MSSPRNGLGAIVAMMLAAACGGSAGVLDGETGGGAGSGAAQTGGSGAAITGGHAGTPLGGSGGSGTGGRITAGAAGAPSGGSGGSVVVPVCQQPAAPGDCLAYMPSFYFNAATGRCESFVFGGCGGNDNRFGTAALCRQACGGPPPAECQLPVDPGPCDGAIPSYYHDGTTGRCQPFVYGGCEGNLNRFASDVECFAGCGDPAVACPLQQPSGACDVAGVSCAYDYFTRCRCAVHDLYYCELAAECSTSGSGGSAADPLPPGSGAAGAGVGMPMPLTTDCTCSGGAWICTNP